MSWTGNANTNPAFAGFSEVLPLSGLSGAHVALLRTTAGQLFVRKAGSDATTSIVLQRQARRQTWLRTAVAGSANVPEVIAEGEAEGLYYFDMPFIASRDAASLLASATFEEVNDFATRVEALMTTLASADPEPTAPRPPTKIALLDKLDEIAFRTMESFKNRSSRCVVRLLSSTRL